MNLFENIHKFGNTFHSIRKHDGYFIIDLKFPPQWVYEELYSKEKIAIKINNTTNEGSLVSFYCGDSLEGVGFLEKDILNIIKFNKDKEEKDKLLYEKTRELEELFNNKKLEELKNINFQVSTLSQVPPLKNSSNGRPNTTNKVVEQPTKEG